MYYVSRLLNEPRHTNFCISFKKSNSANEFIIKFPPSHPSAVPPRVLAPACSLFYLLAASLSWQNAICSSVFTVSFWFTTAVKMKGNQILLIFSQQGVFFILCLILKNALFVGSLKSVLRIVTYHLSGWFLVLCHLFSAGQLGNWWCQQSRYNWFLHENLKRVGLPDSLWGSCIHQLFWYSSPFL